MTDDGSYDRRTNRRHVFNMALVGVVLLGVSVWSLISDKGVEAVLASGAFGVAALTAAVVTHRLLLRRDRV